MGVQRAAHQQRRVAGGQLTRMDREIKSLQAEARDAGLLSAPASATAATCGAAGCPDIVIVHLEFVFDPVLLADYRATGGYLGQMEKKSSAASKSGLLRVHTWGGASWISEFAVLCGVNPTIFGRAGALPHLNLSRYVKNCLPNYLKRLGYETHAIYTSYWNFVGVGAGFKRYGIDDFIDIRRIKGAPTDWHLQRDKFFIDEARRILAQPGRQPRFIFVSTNWNHGPHGQGSHLETYPGPFEIGKASDDPTRDYVNRLNDTFTEMAKLERDLTARGKPTVMLFYGDHHPAFVKKSAPDLPADPYVRTDVLTFYRFARSYGPAGAPPHATLWIEELPTRFLEFAGIPLSRAMATIRALREKCNNTDERCPAPLKIGIPGRDPRGLTNHDAGRSKYISTVPPCRDPLARADRDLGCDLPRRPARSWTRGRPVDDHPGDERPRGPSLPAAKVGDQFLVLPNGYAVLRDYDGHGVFGRRFAAGNASFQGTQEASAIPHRPRRRRAHVHAHKPRRVCGGRGAQAIACSTIATSRIDRLLPRDLVTTRR